MTDDIELVLGDLPEEPPPPEIVLAAVRAFRYRAIATVAAIVAGALLLGVVGRALRPDNLGVEAASLRLPTTVPMLVTADYDGISVAVTELVWDNGTGYLRYLAWDTGNHAEVDLTPVAITTSTGRRIDLELGSSPILENFTSPDRGRVVRRTTGDWVKFDDPDHNPFGPLSLEIEVLDVPLDIVLHGGEIRGPNPTITIHYPGADLQ